MIDVLIIGAGPVGLLSAYLSHLSGLTFKIVDRNSAPLEVGRADALNARTLQLLDMVGLLDGIFDKGLACNTSSIFSSGEFISKDSSWWEELEGCKYKHFLMIGQSYVEKHLDNKLKELNNPVERNKNVKDITSKDDFCITQFEDGEVIQSRYVLGCDGASSFVRKKFQVPFDIVFPNLIWAVVDAHFDTNFPLDPEIVIFQNETSDVAMIPRERGLRRFYVRMDRDNFTLEDVMLKVTNAIQPYFIKINKLDWYSSFSVKESVASQFIIKNKIFLLGDACHIHSVNGGQGLNTGLADAFNLIWKIKQVIVGNEDDSFLQSYEDERKTIAKSVIDVSGKLVRTTKFSKKYNHAKDYIKLIKEHAGNITGMGIKYPGDCLVGNRLYDFELENGTRLYDQLSYSNYTIINFKDATKFQSRYPEIYVNDCPFMDYKNKILFVRPDGHIQAQY